MFPFRFALAIVIAALSTEASAFDLPQETLNFTVSRDGDVVGSHLLHFQTSADVTTVTIDTNVVVKVVMVPVYRFEHHSKEIWRNDRLVGLDSTTNDDGTHHTLKVRGSAGVLEVDGDGVASQLPSVTIPASLWNRATVTQATVMNSLDGHSMAVHITDLGDEAVTVAGQVRQARHFSMVGELNRELWYDRAGVLVQLRFKGKDGSDIHYTLK